jgi:hypothetical protein
MTKHTTECCKIFFWWSRVCWPLPFRPFCIFERCLDSHQESCRSKRATNL